MQIADKQVVFFDASCQGVGKVETVVFLKNGKK